MWNVKFSLAALLIGIAGVTAAPAQQMLLSAPEPQPGHISGTVTDNNGDIVPGATVVLAGAAQDEQTVVANDNGGFQFDNVSPGRPVEVSIHDQGFADWKSA